MLYVYVVLACSLSFGNIIASSQEIDLFPYEKKIFSQNGEDGVLQKIFDLVGTTSKYYVDFGAMDGHHLSNTKLLREKDGWHGLLLDSGYPEDLSINLHKAFITAENICEIFKKYNVPEEFDLISIDIDFNDFYVWKTLSRYYKPRVVLIEFNPTHNFNEDKIVIYDANGYWDQSDYYGASMLALYNLGKKLGYTLIYQDARAVNLFFIRNDVLKASGLTFKNMDNVEKLYAVPWSRLERNNYIPGNPYDPKKRPFVSSHQVM